MKLYKNWRKLLKTYSFISLVGNAAVAISVSGLAVLGILSSVLSLTKFKMGILQPKVQLLSGESTYRKALRSLPKHTDFPNVSARPIAPDA